MSLYLIDNVSFFHSFILILRKVFIYHCKVRTYQYRMRATYFILPRTMSCAALQL